jgi:hypothetical protein
VLGWQAGNILAGPAQSNGLGVVNNIFEIWDVGLYADVDRTGSPPPYMMGDYDETLRDCQRYWQQATVSQRFWATAGSQYSCSSYPFPVEMRAQPTLSLTGTGTNGNASNATLSASSNREGVFQITSNAAGDTYSLTRTYTLNARM